MKHTLFILSLFFAICFADYYGDNPDLKQPVKVEYFKVGDILPPDYVIPDTLIVVDAVNLNKQMGYIEQGIIEATDGKIAKVFYKHCRIK